MLATIDRRPLDLDLVVWTVRVANLTARGTAWEARPTAALAVASSNPLNSFRLPYFSTSKSWGATISAALPAGARPESSALLRGRILASVLGAAESGRI